MTLSANVNRYVAMAMSYATDNRDLDSFFVFIFGPTQTAKFRTTPHRPHMMFINYFTIPLIVQNTNGEQEDDVRPSVNCLYHKSYRHAFKLLFPPSADLDILPKNALRTLARRENDSLRANQRDWKPGSLHLIDPAKTPHACSLRPPGHEPVRIEYPSTIS